MILAKINYENKVQVKDKTRIKNASFITGETATIDKVEIQPSASDIFYDVTLNNYLDWAYTTSGEQVITIRITDTDLDVVTESFNVNVLTAQEDNLFSNDQDIIAYEHDILNYVQKGRNSFLDKHRAAQIEILNELDKSGIWKDNDIRYTASDIVDIQEFKEWSKFLTLKIIFENLSNVSDDKYMDKSIHYNSLATNSMKRAVLRLDKNSDGTNDKSEVARPLNGEIRRV